MTACPATFHLCSRSTTDGFSVVDHKTRRVTDAPTEADARRVAERDYPGCVFGLTTIGSTYAGTLGAAIPLGPVDAVIVVILQPRGDDRYGILGHVVSGVMNAACIPFTGAVWPRLLDLLPNDRRRPTRPS